MSRGPTIRQARISDPLYLPDVVITNRDGTRRVIPGAINRDAVEYYRTELRTFIAHYQKHNWVDHTDMHMARFWRTAIRQAELTADQPVIRTVIPALFFGELESWIDEYDHDAKMYQLRLKSDPKPKLRLLHWWPCIVWAALIGAVIWAIF